MITRNLSLFSFPLKQTETEISKDVVKLLSHCYSVTDRPPVVQTVPHLDRSCVFPSLNNFFFSKGYGLSAHAVLCIIKQSRKQD